MTNAQQNKAFLDATDSRTRHAVLDAIASRYGITTNEALEELTVEEIDGVEGDGPEHLLDYLTGPTRTAVSLLMKRHALTH